VVVTVTVPNNLPIDAELRRLEESAYAAIDGARALGGRRVTGHIERVRPGEAGRRIVDEAREIQARAIVMALPRRRPPGSLFGRTVETVLAERPSRVILTSSTDGRPERAGEPVAA
jgi:APA family basic amino acid/polyamine antiporter